MKALVAMMVAIAHRSRTAVGGLWYQPRVPALRRGAVQSLPDSEASLR